MNSLWVMLWALLGAAPAPQSPRLQQLAAVADSKQATESFWREVDTRGTPLIEAIPGKPNQVLMTFLWRAEDARDELNIGVVGVNKLSFENRVDQLARLGKSDVWYRSYEVEASARFQYFLTWPEGRTPDAHVLERYTLEHGPAYELFKDPRSAKSVRYELGDNTSSYAEGPDAPAESWLQPRTGVAKGSVTTFQSTSAILGNTQRDVSVYTPANYRNSGAGYPLLLVFDRVAYLQTLDVPGLLDNMIAARVIPPVVAVFVDNVDRSVELPCNPAFARFLIEELLPDLRGKYHLTRDGSRNVIAGASYGGLASTYIAHSYPETFGNVLSQSGSYWWHPNYEAEPEDQFARGWNYLPRQFVEGKKLPLRFYLDVGTWEGAGMLTPNRSFRDLLRAKGYDVNYREFVGAHTYLNWRATFPDALISLIGTQRHARQN
ncbi:alpha/beta hydrolase-fold protein [Steroidobacter sp.]|uniref:alpha/beta hydrolase-fold protein n=1 Tax=Steroidobacter sp. TaxID=1978227 RepID=UPI001A3B7D22|nr:alpha/beta hydrolase-fold protein [Steroidobacter sp.]MBL8268492.1 DUF3327 domain-containing protein [Steroidobacter sp.]